jgi:hypothetical protein
MSRIAAPVPVRALAAAAWCAATLAGCTMCPDPYDYSGPVPNGSAPQNDFRARSNGIAPIGAAPRPWPPLVRNERPEPGERPQESVVRVAAALTGTASEEEPAVETTPVPEPPPVAGSSAVVDVVGEEPAGDDPPEQAEASGPAGDGWQPMLFR